MYRQQNSYKPAPVRAHSQSGWSYVGYKEALELQEVSSYANCTGLLQLTCITQTMCCYTTEGKWFMSQCCHNSTHGIMLLTYQLAKLLKLSHMVVQYKEQLQKYSSVNNISFYVRMLFNIKVQYSLLPVTTHSHTITSMTICVQGVSTLTMTLCSDVWVATSEVAQLATVSIVDQAWIIWRAGAYVRARGGIVTHLPYMVVHCTPPPHIWAPCDPPTTHIGCDPPTMHSSTWPYIRMCTFVAWLGVRSKGQSSCDKADFRMVGHKANGKWHDVVANGNTVQ